MVSRNAEFSLARMQARLEQGKVLYESERFPGLRSVADTVTRILAGEEFGLKPVESIVCIDIWRGRIVLSASLILTLIQRSCRYYCRFRKHDRQSCEIDFYQDDQLLGTVVYTDAEAAAHDMTKTSAWQRDPMQVLFACAVSMGASLYCAELFVGQVNTPEELASEGYDQGFTASEYRDDYTGEKRVIPKDTRNSFKPRPSA